MGLCIWFFVAGERLSVRGGGGHVTYGNYEVPDTREVVARPQKAMAFDECVTEKASLACSV
jgi:hypothetical protein